MSAVGLLQGAPPFYESVLPPESSASRDRGSGWAFRGLLFVCWIMPLACLNLHDRHLAPYYVSYDGTTILKMVTRLVTSVVVGLSLLHFASARGHQRIYSSLFPWAMFGLWATASVLWSPLPSLTVGHGAEVVLLCGVAAIAAITCNTERKVSMLFLNMTLVGLAMTVILFVFYRDIVFSTQALIHGKRPGGVLEANAMAGISGNYLILLLGSYFIGKWKWARWLALPGCLIHGLSIYVAHSRGALGVTVLMLTAMALLLGGRRGMLALCVAGALGCAAILSAPNLDRIVDGVNSYVMRGQSTDVLLNGSGRGELWSQAVNSFLDAPTFGHGYFVMSDSGLLTVWRASQWQTAHNLYLHVLTGTGIVGLIPFLGGLFVLVRILLRNVPLPGFRGQLARLALVIAGYWVISGFVELSILGPVNPATFLSYVFIGLAAGLYQFNRPEAPAVPMVAE